MFLIDSMPWSFLKRCFTGAAGSSYVSDIKEDAESIDKYKEAWGNFYCVKEDLYNIEHSGDQVVKTSAVKEKYAPMSKASLFDHMYRNLDILDVKACALLSSTSIFSGFASIMLARLKSPDWKWSIPLLGITFLSFLSVIFAIRVVWVFWSKTEEFEETDLNKLTSTLIVVRNQRTFYYRTAWYLHFSVIVFLYMYLLLHVVFSEFLFSSSPAIMMNLRLSC